jgi:hypothetical protein
MTALDPFENLAETTILPDLLPSGQLPATYRRDTLFSAIHRDGVKSMANSGKATLVESALVLALMGILAGAIGGLAVGAITNPKAAASTTTH